MSISQGWKILAVVIGAIVILALCNVWVSFQLPSVPHVTTVSHFGYDLIGTSTTSSLASLECQCSNDSVVTSSTTLGTEALYPIIALMTRSEQDDLLRYLNQLLDTDPDHNASQVLSEMTSSNHPSSSSMRDIQDVIRSNLGNFSDYAVDAIVASSFHISDLEQTLIENMRNLSLQEQNHVIRVVNGREFPYPLSCPNHTILTTNYSVVVSYHVGMVLNWRDIVRDQMTTVDMCGLGSVLSTMFITYTQNNTKNSFEDLTHIIRRFSFASKVTYLHASNDVLPREGPAVNTLREYCMAQQEVPPSNTTRETVAFYLHNKGVSHYSSDWNQREAAETPWTYSRTLFWRKYLEYYLIERPGVCIDHIVHHGADACGADALFGNGLTFFVGNFWAASCTHLRSVQACQTELIPNLQDPHVRPDLHGLAEGFIGRVSSPRELKFVSLHNNTNGGLYRRLITPDEYSDYSYRWL